MFPGPVWWTKHYIQYPFLVHGISAVAEFRQADKGCIFVHCDKENDKAVIGITYVTFIAFITLATFSIYDFDIKRAISASLRYLMLYPGWFSPFKIIAHREKWL